MDCGEPVEQFPDSGRRQRHGQVREEIVGGVPPCGDDGFTSGVGGGEALACSEEGLIRWPRVRETGGDFPVEIRMFFERRLPQALIGLVVLDHPIDIGGEAIGGHGVSPLLALAGRVRGPLQV